ncbi:hypothetical protein AGMMS49942_17290 [Spirochaetia bacterium]|nr:hypothetical protein AGMMS49942_17290 [Spirochaetia bacterium]
MDIKFSDEEYQKYLVSRVYPKNERIRGEDETIWDAAMEGSKVLKSTPEGRAVLESLAKAGL